MKRRSTLVGLLLLGLAACPGTNADNVCLNIGLCEDQSDPTIDECKAQAESLYEESLDAGCGDAYTTYFGCANSAYTCNGNTPTFPGCQSDLDSLNGCLESAQASTSCGTLARALAACPGADAGGSGPIPSPCTANGVCNASCYLQEVPNVCAPLPAQLSAYQACSAVCF
jgi:hypothetical protein